MHRMAERTMERHRRAVPVRRLTAAPPTEPASARRASMRRAAAAQQEVTRRWLRELRK
jgi:hypothetical protein